MEEIYLCVYGRRKHGGKRGESAVDVPARLWAESDGSVSATFYIDDLFSMEYMEGKAAALDVESAAVISNTPLAGADSLRIGRTDAAQGIHKTYLRFSGDESFKTTQRAALEFDVQEASGQTVRIYGLTDVTYPANLTYNTAPASNEDESMDESKVYGGAPIAELAVNAAGHYTVDVTDYVKNQRRRNISLQSRRRHRRNRISKPRL